MDNQMKEYGLKCWRCGNEVVVMAYEMDVAHYQAGAYMQDALPYLTAAERELFISGSCDDCWKIMFPNSDPLDLDNED